ncbi:MAG: FmdB family zinc ribbon protein [Pyrinomonadaceae bacterium]
MPLYEYECRKCKAHTEVMQKITDKPLTKCRKCGGRLEKQWSSTSFQLKGSGWYVTDYSARKSETKEETKSAATETKSETTPEAKPAEKSKATETPAATKSSKTKTSSSKTATSGD